MKMQPMPITETLLFRLAQLVLPEAMLLSMFGRRVRIEVQPTPAASRRF